MTLRSTLLASVSATALAVAIAACVPESPDLTAPPPPTVREPSDTGRAATQATVVSFAGDKAPESTVIVRRVGVLGSNVLNVGLESGEWVFGPVSLTTGENVFLFTATDRYGNESSANTFVVVSDQADPNPVQILTPVDRTSVPDGFALIRWAPALDNPPPNGSGIKKYEVRIARQPTSLGVITFEVPGSEEPATLTSALAPGWHTLTVRAFDMFDRESTVVPRRFYVGTFGDVNSDGRGDFTSGTPGHDTAVALGTEDVGRAYLWLGSQPVDTNADLDVEGTGANGRLGDSSGIVHDMDGDGRAEVAFGSVVQNRVFVRFDGGGTNVRFDGSGRYGASIASGDIDGDGLAELIVGAPDCDVGTSVFAGCVQIYAGTTAGFVSPVAVSDVTLDGDPAETNGDFGASVAFAGDIDGNGSIEIAVGAPSANGGAGRVYVFSFTGLPVSGSTISATAPGVVALGDGLAAGDRFGASVAGGRDSDGDGLPDLVVGAPDDGGGGTGTGTVYLFHRGALTPTCTISPGIAGSSFGTSVAMVGAFDPRLGGRSAIAVAGPGAGSTRLLVPTAVECLYDAKLYQVDGVTSVAPAGDLGGDGRADFVAGRPAADQIVVFVGTTSGGSTLTPAAAFQPPFISATLPGDATAAGTMVGGVAP